MSDLITDSEEMSRSDMYIYASTTSETGKTSETSEISETGETSETK
jgi:hypothetical protein